MAQRGPTTAAVLALVALALSCTHSKPAETNSSSTGPPTVPDSSSGIRHDTHEADTTRALANLLTKRDDAKGITWYTHRLAPTYANSKNWIELYFGKRDDGTLFLRTKIYYVGFDWLSIEKYVVETDSGTETLFRDLPRLGVHRDKGAYWVAEWVDLPVSSSDVTTIRAIIASRQPVLRYEGLHNQRDRAITPEEKQALQDVLDAYVGLGGSV